MIWDLFSNFIFSKRAGSLVRRIAWLSVTSIAFSVTAFLIVLFVMNGMNSSIEKRIVSLEPHLSVQVDGIRDAKTLELQPVVVKLKSEKNLEVSIYEAQDVILRSAEGQFRGAIAHGISEESILGLQKRLEQLTEEKKSKSAFVEHWGPDEIPGEGEVAIGADLAHALKVNEGDFLTVVPPEGLLLPPGESPKFDRVRIRKVVYTNLSDLDTQMLFYQRGKALTRIQGNTSRKMGLEIWLPDFHQANDLKDQVTKFQGVHAESWMDRNSDLFFALKLEKIAIGLFLGLAGVLSASSIVGVLSLLLFQKRREIKLMRALGLSSAKTLEIFSRMGLILTLVGVVTGGIVGTAFSFYVQFHPLNILSNDVYYEPQIPARVDPWYIVIVLVVGVVVGFSGSYFPAKKISFGEIGKI